MKKLTILLLVLITACTTTGRDLKRDSSKTNNSVKERPDDLYIVKERLSNSVIEKSPEDIREFSAMILGLIDSKSWEEISKFMDYDEYHGFIVDGEGIPEDFCMYMTNTAYKGASTEYSLGDIDRAFYISSYFDGLRHLFEGEYIYPTGESEFFKFYIAYMDSDLILMRE